HDQPVFADGETNSRRGRPAERLGKPVITPAAEDRVLRPQRAMRELERRARVVIEAADQAVVYLKLDTDRLQDFLHRLEVRAAAFVQKLADARQLLDDRLVLGDFAIEYAQRVGDGPALAIGAHLP